MDFSHIKDPAQRARMIAACAAVSAAFGRLRSEAIAVGACYEPQAGRVAVPFH